jgi:hypothetical protein
MSDEQQFTELTEDIEFEGPPDELRAKAQRLYEELRSTNPWMPDPGHVVANEDITVTFGPNSASTINLTMFINLPDELIP